MNDLTMVTAIITSYNEQAAKINQTLQNLLGQKTLISKIILVDDGSWRIPLQLENLVRDDRIMIISLPNNHGISEARNIAIQQVLTDYLLIQNIEITLAADWITECLKLIQREQNIGAVYGKLVPESGNKLITKWRMRFQEQKYPSQEGISSFAPGHAVLFRRAAMLAVNGYDKQYRIVNEDADICKRMGKRGYVTYYTPNALCFSHQKDTIHLICKKQIVRLTSGRINELGVINFLKENIRDFTNRIIRNIIKLRWYFLPIDIYIFFAGFYFYFIRSKRKP